MPDRGESTPTRRQATRDRAGGIVIDTQHRHHRILVALDDADRQAALARRLRDHGHEVVSAASQAQALILLHDYQVSFDLVVMDADDRRARRE
ncbi:MAG: hypothetical protein ACQEXJ_17475 [Myxococcota bacterium]